MPSSLPFDDALRWQLRHLGQDVAPADHQRPVRLLGPGTLKRACADGYGLVCGQCA
jgi:hypothetical protein